MRFFELRPNFLGTCEEQLDVIIGVIADHVLFASDCPFDKEKGRGYIRATIEVMQSLELPQSDLEKICHRNAEIMFGLRWR